MEIDSAEGCVRRMNKCSFGQTVAHGVGIQLIIFAEQVINDFASVVAACKQAGYSYIEAPLAILKVRADHVRAVTEKEGIPLLAIHVGYPTVESHKGLASAVDYLREAGGKVLISSGLASGHNSWQSYEQSAKKFNDAGKYCSERSVSYCYHTHDWEYHPDSLGVRGVDRLLKATDKEIVRFNLDIFWAYVAGANPVLAMKELGSRCDYYHFKDGRRDKEGVVSFQPLGDGKVNIQACLQQAVSSTAQPYIVVEQDRPVGNAEDDINKSRSYLRQFGL